MKKKIFGTTLFMSCLSLLAGIALVIGILYGHFSELMLNELSDEAHYISTGIRLSGSDYLENLTVTGTKRITLIAPDGTVTFDSEADITGMDNHSDREEFVGALQNGEGSSTRYSSTLSTKTIYYALRLHNNYVLRTAYTQSTIWSLILGILPQMIVILAAVVLISILISWFISKRIAKPIVDIDLNNPDISEGYDELIPLIKKINNHNKEKEQLEQMRREFTSNVSHELKTPLTSISGMSELLMSGIVSKEDTMDFGKSIHEESARLITLVNDIIKLSQLDEGIVPAPVEKVDLYSLSEEILARFKSTAIKRGIALELTGETAFVDGVRIILDEMISNLCDNAIKYNNDDGSVTVNITSDEHTVILTVSDTGIGIPKEHLNRVFERFYRVDKSHSKQIGGTGLGLSIVKHAAMFHEAAYNIDSTVGTGTTITITFKKP